MDGIDYANSGCSLFLYLYCSGRNGEFIAGYECKNKIMQVEGLLVSNRSQHPVKPQEDEACLLGAVFRWNKGHFNRDVTYLVSGK